MIIKIVLLVFGIFLFILMYSLMMVAKTSDERAERMYQEHMEWKRRKEKSDDSEMGR